MRSFKPEDKLSRVQEIPSTDLDQETILMNIDAGAYYGLKGPARSIWEKLESPLTFSALVDLLVKEYQIEPEACAADLNGFLAEMEREGLLHVE
jgi:hypothetical protein